MGCFSSKMVYRTGSFRGLPILEDLPSSKIGGDRFLTLLYTTNTVVMNLKEQQGNEKTSDLLDKITHAESKFTEFQSPIMGHDTVDAWELMAGLDEEEEDEEEEEENKERKILERAHHKQKQSKDSSQTTCWPDLDCNCLLPVEEIHVDDFLSFSSDEGDEDSTDKHGELVVVDCKQKEESDFEEQSLTEAAFEGLEDTEKSEAVEAFACTDLDTVIIRDIDSDSMQYAGNGEQVNSMKELTNSEKEKCYPINVTGEGELQAFRIPSFKFCGVGYPRLSIESGEEESASGCATPKFGCYAESDSRHLIIGSRIFHDELVAHLEEAMGQFTVEEEHVLMKIVEDFLEKVQDTS